MRKRRAVVFDDELVVRLVLKDFLESRGYEVLLYETPVVCPLYDGVEACPNEAQCGDVILTDYKMPGMNGIELLQAQARKGCRLTSQNKALLTGYMDERKESEVRALGAAFFEKPLLFDEMGRWLDECEQRMDLSKPLGGTSNKTG